MTVSFLKFMTLITLRDVLIAILFMLIVAPTGFVSAETIAPPAIMEISFQNNLISAELADAPLIDVLEKIRQEFGFKVHFHGDLTELITLSFTDVSLEKCLRLLTANQSLSVATRATTKTAEQNGAKQIAEIWVLSRNTAPKRSTGVNGPSVKAAASPAPLPDQSGDGVADSQLISELADEQGQENISLEQVLNNPEAERSSQRAAINKLAAIGDAASVAAMARFLGHEDKEIRQLLVNGVSSVQNEEAVLALGQVISSESDPEIRKIAVAALGKRIDDAIAKAFLEEALNDADDEIKTLAGQLLGE